MSDQSMNDATVDIEKARVALQRFCDGRPTMCIPPQQDDDDYLLSNALDELETLRITKVIRDDNIKKLSEVVEFYSGLPFRLAIRQFHERKGKPIPGDEVVTNNVLIVFVDGSSEGANVSDVDNFLRNFPFSADWIQTNNGAFKKSEVRCVMRIEDDHD